LYLSFYTGDFQVYYVQGGVARNIAECMSKLGAKPFMISALGFDMAGKFLLSQSIFLQCCHSFYFKHLLWSRGTLCGNFNWYLL